MPHPVFCFCRRYASTVSFAAWFAAVSICSLPVLAAESAEGAPRHVRLTWTTDPATSATVSWTTDVEGTANEVRLRADGSEEWATIACQRTEQFNGRLEGEPVPFAHHARLTDLEPATKYHVICQSDGKASREFYFFHGSRRRSPHSATIWRRQPIGYRRS